MEQLLNNKQQNNVELEYIQQQLVQLQIEMSHSKTLINEIRDKVIEPDTVQAKTD